MPAKPKIEYRLVCAQHGTKGHSTHAYSMPKDAKVRTQKVIDMNHHCGMMADRSLNRSMYYKNEIPWTIQEREVGAWKASE